MNLYSLLRLLAMKCPGLSEAQLLDAQELINQLEKANVFGTTALHVSSGAPTDKEVQRVQR